MGYYVLGSPKSPIKIGSMEAEVTQQEPAEDAGEKSDDDGYEESRSQGRVRLKL
jgi:hypothetical protein